MKMFPPFFLPIQPLLTVFCHQNPEKQPWPLLAYKLLCSVYSGTKSKTVRRKKIMKMTSILIAVFAVIAAVSAAKAEEIVNFDGKGIGARSFMEAIKSADSCRNDSITCEQPKPTPVLLNAGLPVESRVDDAAKKAEPVFSPRMAADMDASIGSAIAYVNTHGYGPQLRPGLECLRDQGTLKEKFNFVYPADDSNYLLPDRCMQPSTKGACTCVAWDWKDVCYDTTVYQDVCTMVAGVCAAGAWIGGVWTIGECTGATMVCKAVAIIVPQCIPRKYCSQQINCGPTFG